MATELTEAEAAILALLQTTQGTLDIKEVMERVPDEEINHLELAVAAKSLFERGWLKVTAVMVDPASLNCNDVKADLLDVLKRGPKGGMDSFKLYTSLPQWSRKTLEEADSDLLALGVVELTMDFKRKIVRK